jgi:hypothetical protein
VKLFIDTADIDEIRTIARWGVLDGVTTNPSLFAKTSGMTYDEVLAEICRITDGPGSAEVIADDVDGRGRFGRHPGDRTGGPARLHLRCNQAGGGCPRGPRVGAPRSPSRPP